MHFFHCRTSSLPNFFGSFVTQQQHQQQLHSADSSKETSSNVSLAQSGSDTQQFLVTKPPPQYEEATKQLKVKQVSTHDVIYRLVWKVLSPLLECVQDSVMLHLHYVKTQNYSVRSVEEIVSCFLAWKVCLQRC